MGLISFVRLKHGSFLLISQQGRDSPSKMDIAILCNTSHTCNHEHPFTINIFSWLDASLAHIQGEGIIQVCEYQEKGIMEPS